MPENFTLPPGWSKDSLTDYMESAYRNRIATFVNNPGSCRWLITVDRCFMRVAQDWLNPTNLLTPQFFFRCHSAYRATCELAMAGQATDAFPQMRACLEYAGYGLRIHKNPDLGQVWLRRHDDAGARKAVLDAFTVASIRQTIEMVDRHTAEVFRELYDRTIDFGGHPNERAITGSMEIVNHDDRKTYSAIYLHKDGQPLDHVLKSTAQTGVCALHILREVFPERFELLGINAELPELSKGL